MDDAAARAMIDGPPFVTEARAAFARAVAVADDAVASFLDQALDDLRDEAIEGLEACDVAALLAEFWSWAGQRSDATADLDLGPARGAGARDLGLDVLWIAQPDRPFLVDSVMAELSETGLEPLALVHPVVAVTRSSTGARVEPTGSAPAARESMILVLLARVGEDRQGAILQALREVLAEVRAVVEDQGAIRALFAEVEHDLETRAPAAFAGAADRQAEDLAFLRWLAADRFVFLGARVYAYPLATDGGYAAEEPQFSPATSYGVLRDPQRAVLRRASEPAVLTRDLAAHLRSAESLIVAKSNLRSRVHRRVYSDYVGIKRYDADGRAIGETRFVGLFTLEAYGEPVREVPLIRRKVEHVIAQAGAQPSAHTLKRLRHIAETYPRDELFQIDEATLYVIVQGVLHLYERPRVRLFVRNDPFDRFISVMMYFPRDQYDASVRERAAAILKRAWRGRISAYYPSFSSDPLVRVHFIVGVTPRDHPSPDARALEAEITAAIRTWRDHFEAAVRSAGGAPGEVRARLARYGDAAFAAGYRDAVDAAAALLDVGEIEALAGPGAVRVRAFRDANCTPRQFRFKLYRQGETAAPLADVLPILENMGLKALEEEGHPVRPSDAPCAWIHTFLIEDDRGERLTFDDVRQPFEHTFVAVWSGAAENDGFNRLALELGVDWRDAALVRALARFRQQSGQDPSQAVQIEAVCDSPQVVRLILDLFRVRLDPTLAASRSERAERAEAIKARIAEALQEVASLDADRALRRLADLVAAIQRTNFYQTDGGGAPRAYVSFKIASREVVDLPAPKPFREIFVSGPVVDGVHLRFGAVARGGLRWSDRRDDFRTEVLGLVKAQQVKNAVIVPVGSKGGFFAKQSPRGGDAASVRAEGVRAYTTFLHGLLDVTDNLDPSGAVVHPPQVVDWDGDDPYLVVAADKGTASFSDTANRVANAAGFWLGDAFASGGSAGYDHKAMGITARGAWEAVKRHFREMGKDIQTERFTMIGIGDMSGDVFGNGALLSRQIRLVAAFDHRHVFLDPDPDPATSFAERRRLFELPRSSWGDYDPRLISAGGGVFARDAKRVALSPQARALLGLDDDDVTPAELVRAVLRAPAELLYLGGIGTYVKAAGETHAEVGDKANDAVRIDAGELRAQVIGEGANLGLTQAARIAYARGDGARAGRINTDAIDNSAGVDTSDHEVNIKILLGQAIADGALAAADRDALLASMTDDVARRVLAHNHAQTLALSLQQAGGLELLPAQSRFMGELVAAGRLDRRLEGLPGPQALLDMAAQKQGLTRPELAVLTAYGKLELSAAIVGGSAPDDPFFAATLEAYFPPALERFGDQMRRHRLRREIVATTLANAVVDRLGPTFAGELAAETGADAGLLVTAFAAAGEVFGLDEVWRAVDAEDGRIDAAVQSALYREVAAITGEHVYTLTRRLHANSAGAQAMIEAYGPAAAELAGGDASSEPAQARARAFVEAGAPPVLAAGVARLRDAQTIEIADAARLFDRSIAETARVFRRLGARLGLDRLRAAAAAVAPADVYERAAIRGLVGEFQDEQIELTGAVIAKAQALASPAEVDAALDSWASERSAALARLARAFNEIELSAGGWSFAKLALVNAALRRILG